MTLHVGNILPLPLPLPQGLFHVVLAVSKTGTPTCWCALTLEEARQCAEWLKDRATGK